MHYPLIFNCITFIFHHAIQGDIQWAPQEISHPRTDQTQTCLASFSMSAVLGTFSDQIMVEISGLQSSSSSEKTTASNTPEKSQHSSQG